MATRTDNDVTLTHEQAEKIAKLLSDYAYAQAEHATRTRSEAVRSECRRTAQQARELAEEITRRLWTWEEEPAPHQCALPPSIVEALNSGDGVYRP